MLHTYEFSSYSFVVWVCRESLYVLHTSVVIFLYMYPLHIPLETYNRLRILHQHLLTNCLTVSQSSKVSQPQLYCQCMNEKMDRFLCVSAFYKFSGNLSYKYVVARLKICSCFLCNRIFSQFLLVLGICLLHFSQNRRC